MAKLPTPITTGLPAAPAGTDAKADGRADLRRTLRGPVIGGVAVVAAFFAGFGGWAATAPLASAAIAPGVISPDGSRRTVQHLEGGIIGEILVKNGDEVTAGEPLVVLQDIQASAQYDQLMGQYNTFLATQARLLAEQAEKPEIAYPAALLDQRHDPDVAEVIAVQSDLFASRRESLESQKAVLDQRIAQLEEEIAGLR
ncbi:MAG TPA: HlyD family type I secretion periplasmic adaptor subunit, partial [Alphaproteobacteria bacterium]|nr:HlyD family type I secretion periplasmic adaptor subunit [Alphaproteobacteria bacterium]